jgi:hypothetical protein
LLPHVDRRPVGQRVVGRDHRLLLSSAGLWLTSDLSHLSHGLGKTAQGEPWAMWCVSYCGNVRSPGPRAPLPPDGRSNGALAAALRQRRSCCHTQQSVRRERTCDTLIRDTVISHGREGSYAPNKPKEMAEEVFTADVQDMARPRHRVAIHYRHHPCLLMPHVQRRTLIHTEHTRH